MLRVREGRGHCLNPVEKEGGRLAGEERCSLQGVRRGEAEARGDT